MAKGKHLKSPVVENIDVNKSMEEFAQISTPVNCKPISRRSLKEAHKNLTTDFLCVAQNDDELERRERRRDSLREEKLLNVDGKGDLAPVIDLKNATVIEAAVHYSNCLKLSAQNKITQQNAFYLELIDYMGEMMKKNDSRLKDFQTASCVLDASAKIYASRVDRLHTDSMKIACAFGRDDKLQKSTNEEIDEKNGKTTKSKAKKSKIMVDKKSIIKNKESLNGTLIWNFNLEFSYSYMKKKFGDCRPGRLNFLPFVETSNDSNQMKLLKCLSVDESADTQSSGTFPSSAFEEESVLLTSRLPQEWLDRSESNQSFQLKPDEPFSDAINLDLSVEEEEEKNENFKLTMLPDDQIDDMQVDECINETVAHFGNSHKAENLINLADIITTDNQEYTFYNMKAFCLWKGPHQLRKHYSTKDHQKKLSASKTARNKKEVTINFICAQEDYDDAFKADKHSQIAPKTMHYVWNIAKTTKPPVTKFNPSSLTKYFNVEEKFPVTCKVTKVVNFNPGRQSIYTWEDYCPSVKLSDIPEDLQEGANVAQEETVNLFEEDIDGGQGDQTVVWKDPLVTEWRLLTPPPKIEKYSINFAKTAKKVNMKKLKKAMWEILNKEDSPIRESFGNMSSQSLVEMDTNMHMEEPMSFSTLYEKLRTILPFSMAEKISAPLAFSALLHLANELTLRLKQESDIIITQEEG